MSGPKRNGLSFVFCIVLTVASSATVPLVSQGYAKTSVAGSMGSAISSARKYIPQMRSVMPALSSFSYNDHNRSRIVPTSFSGNRLPLMKRLPEVSQGRSMSSDAVYSDEDTNTKEVSVGRALSEPSSLSSAIARSFQDVLPSDINSLTSPSTTEKYDAEDIQKSPLAAEYSYGSGNPYYSSPDSKSSYSSYDTYPVQNGIASSPSFQRTSDSLAADKNSLSYSRLAQERYHPQRPYQAGYPADYFNSPPTGTVSDVGDITAAQPVPINPGSSSLLVNNQQPVGLSYSAPGAYGPYPYPPPPEEPLPPEEDDSDLDKGVYTHYNIGRKLYYAPLWFSLYYIGYLFVEVCKHVWRHKYTYPVRAEDALGIGRSGNGDSAVNSTEALDHITKIVTKAIESTTKKYKSS